MRPEIGGMDAYPSQPRICVAGAGAIGCTLAARLLAAGQQVTVLARGRSLQQLRDHGLQLDDLRGRITLPVAAHDQPDFGTQDVIFLCCKSHDLPLLAAQIQPLIGPQTLIVPLVNGVPFWYFQREGGRFDGAAVRAVDPQAQLLALLPAQQLIGAVVFITAELVAAGQVVSKTPHLLMLGEPGGGASGRLRWLCGLLEQAGIEARSVERLRDKLWTKILANLSSNPLSVVTGATLQAIYTEPVLLETVRAVLHEGMLVACAYGARLEIDPTEFVRLGAAMGPVRTSMLQDFSAGRPLELAAIGGAVLELAGHYGLPMPATETLIKQARWHADHRAPDLRCAA
jgi:2-dehydropantoate 2-reductase